jgi:microcystin-dependent protein
MPQQQKAHSGTVHRHDKARERRQARKQKKRPCRSAPSVPGSVTVTFGRRKSGKKDHWRARVKWNAVTTDVAGRTLAPERYAVQLRATDSGGNAIELDGPDEAIWRVNAFADEALHAVFSPLARPRAWYYQARVRCMNRVHGARCWSAWSAWTTPARAISGGPNNPLNVTTTKPRPGHLLTTWDDPTSDPEDVDRFIVRVYNLGVLRETTRTRSNRHRYVIPDADRGTAHSVRVKAVDEEGIESSEQQGDATDDIEEAVVPWEVGDVRKRTGTTVPATWLNTNGQYLLVSAYPELWGVIGYTYDLASDAHTTSFRLPDFNGRNAIGASSVYAMGSTEGSTEANRSMAHLHGSDAASTTPTSDAASTTPTSDAVSVTAGFDTADNAVTSDAQSQTPTSDASGESAGHTHPLGMNTGAASVGISEGGTGTPTDLTRQGHTHNVPGPTGARDPGHGHGHTHGGHGHNHGHGIHNHNHQHSNGHGHNHNHGGHGHGHNHGGHGHGHQHDNQTRPHVAVKFIIKALP